MPDAFFDDWVRIAAEEAKHFSKWNQRLEELGGRYGDYLAHDGLWVSGTDTAHSLRARLAIVHMVTPMLYCDTGFQAVIITCIMIGMRLGTRSQGSRHLHIGAAQNGEGW